MTPYPGSPLSLGLDGMVDTPTPEMQRSVEEGIERHLRARRLPDHWTVTNQQDYVPNGPPMSKAAIAEILDIAKKRQALCGDPPTCSCGSKQVQLISWITTVRWRCRDCRTEIVKETDAL